MLSKIKNIIWKPESLGQVKAPLQGVYQFALLYKKEPVGELTFADNKWTFKYSIMFQNNDNIKALVDFPDKSKVYVSNELWPFFLSRIPGLGQPEVQRIIKKETIDKTSEAALLIRFGNKSISNPFILELV